MTLYDVVVFGGLAVSTILVGVLASFWPFERDRALCLKVQQDEECTPDCLRTCHLKAA